MTAHIDPIAHMVGGNAAGPSFLGPGVLSAIVLAAGGLLLPHERSLLLVPIFFLIAAEVADAATKPKGEAKARMAGGGGAGINTATTEGYKLEDHTCYTSVRPDDVELNCFEKGVTGTIPPAIGKLTGLTRVYLMENRLTGPIPPELGKLTRLLELDLYANRLRGPIPPALGALTRLEHMFIQNNDLTGAIPPALGGLARLTRLWAFNNLLSGCVPRCLDVCAENFHDYDTCWVAHTKRNIVGGGGLLFEVNGEGKLIESSMKAGDKGMHAIARGITGRCTCACDDAACVEPEPGHADADGPPDASGRRPRSPFAPFAAAWGVALVIVCLAFVYMRVHRRVRTWWRQKTKPARLPPSRRS